MRGHETQSNVHYMYVALTEHTELPKLLGLSIWTNKEAIPQLTRLINNHGCDATMH